MSIPIDNKIIKPVAPFCKFSIIDDDYCECIYCGNKALIKNIKDQPFLTCKVATKFLGITGDFRIIAPAPPPINLSYNQTTTTKNQLIKIPFDTNKLRPSVNGGPGTELKSLLKFIGITASPNCKCNSRAKQMDAWGCDVCETKIDEIVGWLKEEAYNRKLPFVETAAKLLIKRAIKNARKKLKPSP